MNAVIETVGLAKFFGDIHAVSGITLSIHQGEMFGLVGPDGAGKTTTIRMLCGILTPSSGSATVLGIDLLDDPDRVKKEIGYLSQKFSLYGDLTIDENIEFFAEINKVYDFKKPREELLEFTRLAPFRTRLAEKLSGGMKQKLALACTLIHTPKILLLDEPTTGVDPVSRRDFWRILQSLQQRGITIIMSTPYLDEAERCTRVGLISGGTLLQVDTPANLKKMMGGEVVEVVCDRVREAYRILKNDRQIREVQAFGDRLNIVLDNAVAQFPSIGTQLTDAGIRLVGWRVLSPSLENVFISLLTHPASNEAA
ncbi:MAG: ABC transporter ATP-binding protein [Ignavibacteriae bacterium]|nr:ABC transporter ATP-binding protein [Ignavibacteria bacterium]MBI3363887.1 ABC transporter ATP-binding protein [Ignavibacteriota bacterium]